MQPLRHQARTVRRADQLSDDDPDNLTTDDKKLVFAYDYLNRRVRKLVYAWDPNEGASGDWSSTAELDLRFIYHERLLLLELDGHVLHALRFGARVPPGPSGVRSPVDGL